MPRRVFVTGGTGFVGRSVIRHLLDGGHDVTALARDGTIEPQSPRLKPVKGDLFDQDALARGLDGCDAAIHLVGIIREDPRRGATFERVHAQGTLNVVDAAKKAGVVRYVQMSAMGARHDAPSCYHRTKFEAEQNVRSSDLAWTIFRPSLIHGPGSQLMQMEEKWARGSGAPFLFMPYFGGGLLGRRGAGQLQPVYVEDVARAFVESLDNPRAVEQTYELGGNDIVSWPQLHRQSAEAFVGRRRWVAPIPAWYATLLTRVVPAALLPFNRDQVQMSQEDNAGDVSRFINDFGWEPRGFRETLGIYAGKDRTPS